MPNRRRDEEETQQLIEAPSREQYWDDDLSKDISLLRGYDQLTQEQQDTLVRSTQIYAEFYYRAIHLERFPNVSDRILMQNAFVSADAVMDEEENANDLGIPSRLLQGAHLLATRRVMRMLAMFAQKR